MAKLNILAITICIQIIFLPQSFALASKAEQLTVAWNKFWSTTCGYSKVVSRTRRSVPQEPKVDLEDSVEIFKYLYPLADVTSEEYEAGNVSSGTGSGRSFSSSNKFTAWSLVDDALDLWQHECQRRKKSSPEQKKKKKREGQRRRRRATVRNQGIQIEAANSRVFDNMETEDLPEGTENKNSQPYPSDREPDILDIINRAFYTKDQDPNQSQSHNENAHLLKKTGEYAPIEEDTKSRISEKDNKDDGGEIKYKDEDKDEEKEDDEDEEEEDDDDEDEDDDDEDEDEDKEKDKEEKKEEDEEETTTTAAPETTTAVAAAAAEKEEEEDPFFSSYGGDIEYFFPLISFTIPWDGQITVLGFHGFKGMGTF